MIVMLGWAAAAAGSDRERVTMKDDCDPATFNAAIGPGTCVGDGRTTFQNFIAQLQANGVVANRSARGWAFRPGQLELESGRGLEARNRGGETHTFTEVANYGGGCVPPVNAALGGLTPVPECATPAFAATRVPAGGSLNVAALAPGLHHFECLIHPWMRTDVVVGQHENDDEDDD
jgi:plastocyanin